MFPLPFNRIALRWQRWPAELPARLSPEQAEAFARDLEAVMNAQAEEADMAVGHDAAQT